MCDARGFDNHNIYWSKDSDVAITRHLLIPTILQQNQVEPIEPGQG
jgi:hypothetical protein